MRKFGARLNGRPLRGGDFAFALAVLLVVGTYVALISSHLRLPLEYDEAFNITVVENFAERFFYGTNGAINPSAGPQLFDPLITTGPTLLLPAALVWRLSNGAIWATRLAPVAVFGLYLFGCWAAAKGLLSRWYRLAMVAGPLTLVVPTGFEHAAFVPTRMVGETTAATMILWGLLLASRGRMWWGGLLVGLAVQTKFVAAIPAAVVVIAVLIIVHANRGADRWRQSLRWMLGAMVPTLLFEASRLLALGWDRYVDNTDQIFNYSRSVAQLGDKDSSDAMTKLTSLGNMFYTHSFLVVTGAFVVMLALAAFAVANPDRSTPDQHVRERAWSMATFVSVSVLAGGSSLLFWILAVQERSGRHALLGILLLFPGLALFLAYLVSAIKPRRLVRIPLSLALAATMAFVVIDSATKSAESLARESVFDEQVRVARIIEESGTPSIDVDGWWQRPEFQILTDLPVETPSNAARLLIFDSIQGGYMFGSTDMTAFPSTQFYAEKCLYSVYESPNYVLCRPS
jgi:hypothetical protein